MALENYRDVGSYGSNSPGFQFEFHCSNCANVWKTAFKPYRKGQAAGFFSSLLMYVHGMRNLSAATRLASDAGLQGAKKAALDEAMARADTLYSVCSKCRKAVCESCFSARDGLCQHCVIQSGGPSRAGGQGRSEDSPQQAAAMSCPNCRGAHGGGRFCAECGFDMASTHKSCPDCGVMALRQARFCNDCGHGF